MVMRGAGSGGSLVADEGAVVVTGRSVVGARVADREVVRVPVAADVVAAAPVPASDAPVSERRRRFEAEALVHLDAMYSFALKLARSRDDAEDLVSDTLLRAFERWEQYRLGTNIRAWLFTILYHVFVSRKRRIDAREVQQPTGEDGDAWAGREPVGEVDPEGRFYDSFLDEEITRAIDALPEEYRSAVLTRSILTIGFGLAVMIWPSATLTVVAVIVALLLIFFGLVLLWSGWTLGQAEKEIA
jgi:RNA polymerase sigma-70 factor (ECF subfamily)